MPRSRAYHASNTWCKVLLSGRTSGDIYAVLLLSRVHSMWPIQSPSGLTYLLFKASDVMLTSNMSLVHDYSFLFDIKCGPGSSVGIATELRAGRSAIESRWRRDFPPVQTGPGAHPASCTMGTGSFPGVKCGRGVLLTTHPLLVPRSWKSRAKLLPTLWATPGL